MTYRIAICDDEQHQMIYVINGLDDIEKPISEQLKNRLKQERYASLFEREDFQELMRS